MAAVLVAVLALVAAIFAGGAQASVPAEAPRGDPWAVSLGDSYISGEAGRWAGNESGTTDHIDALGRSAYWDAGDRESIEACHRSRSAAIHIGVVRSLNLACSGALTATHVDDAGNFKPGIDFFAQGQRKGQALMLQEFAARNRVAMVALSIGGNDFDFEGIIEQCVKDYLKPWPFSASCRQDRGIAASLAPDRVAKVRSDIRGAILNVAEAMERAGYEDGQWTLVVQTYPLPLPKAEHARYGQSGYDRQVVGGCGFTDADLDWAAGPLLGLINGTVVGAARDAVGARPSLRLETLDTSRAFEERQLCHDAVWRVRESSRGVLQGAQSWRDPDAVDRSEWVMEINIVNLRETYQQESLHPNYWGQLALRNCWRQVWNAGVVQGGSCERGALSGLTQDCEPHMQLITASGRPAVRRDASSAPVSVTLRCPGLTVDAGSTAILRGRVTPVAADVALRLQVSLDGGAWRDGTVIEPGAGGHYRVAYRIPRSAPEGLTYRWRVAALSGGHAVAVSPTRTAAVRRS